MLRKARKIFFQTSFFTYMISLFQVKVTKREEGKKDEKFIRNLHKGDFFGEKALQGYVDIINGTHTVFPQVKRI